MRSSPAGGLEYDPERNSFIAQLYVGYPHLAIADLASGKIQQNLWSEESAMGLAKVDGDWLCSWASGWDPGSVSELRIIDQTTGFVKYRKTLGQVHSAMAPILPERNSFLALVTTDSVSGNTAIRKYSCASIAPIAALSTDGRQMILTITARCRSRLRPLRDSG